MKNNNGETKTFLLADLTVKRDMTIWIQSTLLKIKPKNNKNLNKHKQYSYSKQKKQAIYHFLDHEINSQIPILKPETLLAKKQTDAKFWKYGSMKPYLALLAGGWWQSITA